MKMGNEWRKVTLSEVSDLTLSSVDKKTKSDEHAVRLCNYMDVYNNSFIQEGIDFMEATATEREITRCSLASGDVVITKDSEKYDDIGVPAVVREDVQGLVCGYHLAILRPIPDKIDGNYLFYALNTREVQHQFHAYTNGVTRFGLRKADISRVEVLLPPLSEQRRIAHILGALDDKIELNRRMNSTLEEMAQALFKSWFVNFDPVRAKMEGRWRRGESLPGMPAELYELFPEQLFHSALGDLPEGWEVKRVNDVAEQVAMGPFGSSIKVSTFVDDGIPVINGRHLKGTRLEDIDYRFITEDHAQKLAKANVFPEDIVLTHRGNIGQVSYIPTSARYDRYVVSQSQFYLRCDPAKISPLFVLHFFKTPEGQHQLLANSSSTGVPSIARPVTYLRSIEFCVPPKGLWSLFDSIVRQFHLRAGWNSTESSTLAALRDALLPKLVSGQL